MSAPPPGPGAATAEAVLQRLLLTLPLAARDGGVRIETLAAELAVDPRRILRDLEEMETRSYYLPAGLGDQIQITLTHDHLGVWTTGEFQRPVRLTPKEALALEIGLRVVCRSGSAGEDSDLEDLHARLVGVLRTPRSPEEGDRAIALAGAESGEDAIWMQVEAALREGRELQLLYRPPGRDPKSRRVGPLVLAHAEGHWYLLARDLERDGLRAFRMDRTLRAEGTDTRFARSPEDDSAVERYFQGGRIHDGGGSAALHSFEAVVEYSPEIARWVRERGWKDVEELESGGLRVRHQVFDPEWLLRHVLSYGPEATVVEPKPMRERVVEVMRTIESRATAVVPRDDPAVEP